MPYLKAALVASLAAIATLVTVGAGQIWLTGFTLDRELNATIHTGRDGAYAVVESVDVNMLPALGLALAAFFAVFVWRLRRQPRATA